MHTTGGVGEQAERSRISAFSVFEKDIEPVWEDKANKNGSEFHFMFNMNSAQQNYVDFVNPLWEDIVLKLISGQFPHEDKIAGVRLADKSKGEGLVIRLEVWLRAEGAATPEHLEIRNFVLEEILKKHDLPSDEGLPKYMVHR